MQIAYRATASRQLRGQLAMRGTWERRPRSQRALPDRCWCAECCTRMRTRPRGGGCRCAGAAGAQHSAARLPTCSSCRASSGPAEGPPYTGAHCSMTATHYRESVLCCMPSDNCSPLVQSISPCAVDSLQVFPCKVCQNQNAML